jgi:hypothetical protein
MTGLQDFANPRSMITPGIAGAITMFITNALAAQFDLPHQWVGLGISFLMGLIVFASQVGSGVERGSLYVVNSLIIFSTAFGTNGVAVHATQTSATPVAIETSATAPETPAATSQLTLRQNALDAAQHDLTVARERQAEILRAHVPPIAKAGKPPIAHADQERAAEEFAARPATGGTTADIEAVDAMVTAAQRKVDDAQKAVLNAKREPVSPATVAKVAPGRLIKPFFRAW